MTDQLPPPPQEDVDVAIGGALLETEHLPGLARRGPYFRSALAELGWVIVPIRDAEDIVVAAATEVERSHYHPATARGTAIGQDEWGRRLLIDDRQPGAPIMPIADLTLSQDDEELALSLAVAITAAGNPSQYKNTGVWARAIIRALRRHPLAATRGDYKAEPK